MDAAEKAREAAYASQWGKDLVSTMMSADLEDLIARLPRAPIAKTATRELEGYYPEQCEGKELKAKNAAPSAAEVDELERMFLYWAVIKDWPRVPVRILYDVWTEDDRLSAGSMAHLDREFAQRLIRDGKAEVVPPQRKHA